MFLPKKEKKMLRRILPMNEDLEKGLPIGPAKSKYGLGFNLGSNLLPKILQFMWGTLKSNPAYNGLKIKLNSTQIG